MSDPLSVKVFRGEFEESVHLVDVAVVGLDGHRSGRGAPTRGVLARSAIKPIQAVPLIESGAADAFDLSSSQLALACASHNGEPFHLAVVTDWLAQIGWSASTLECGGHPPIHEPSRDALVRARESFDARHNNCSGKHCGFLSVCGYLGIDPQGYLAADHPLHLDHVTPAIEELCGVALGHQVPAVDGCGIPVWEIPLDRLAAGWASLTERESGRRLLDAMAEEPAMVAGTGRLCTRVMDAAGGRVMVKTGAEGVYAAVVPGSSLGIAIKARDGARRAAEAALLWVLADLGVAVDVELEPVQNCAGTDVGRVTAVD